MSKTIYNTENNICGPIGKDGGGVQKPSAVNSDIPVAISVVMPVYNTPKDFLCSALEGVLRQSFDDFEFLVIDDGSDQPTKDILHRYASLDRRVKIITCPHSNAGQARNEGLYRAKGKAIIFLDSDDIFDPDLLRLSYDRLVETDADMVVFPYREYIDSEHSTMGGCHLDGLPVLFSPKDYPEDIFIKLFPGTWNKLFRLSFFKEQNLSFQSIRATNDLCCILTAITRAKMITLLNTPLIHYRVSNTVSLVHSVDNLVPYHLDACLQLKKNLETDGTWSLYRKPFYSMFILCSALRFFDLPVREQRKTEKYIRQKYLVPLELTGEVIPLLPDYLQTFAELIILGKPSIRFGKARYVINEWKEIFFFGQALWRYKTKHRLHDKN